jgi:hypothetical protein
VRGHALAAEFDVAAGPVELFLAQTAPGTVRGTIELAGDAAPAEVMLSFAAGPARFVAHPDQQLSATGRELTVRAAAGTTFAVADADPTRPLTIEVASGSLRGSVTVQPVAGGEVEAALLLETAGAIAFTHDGAWPQERIALRLRREGEPWPEPSWIEGMRGRTGPLVWPSAPGAWEWRVDGLPGADGEPAPRAEGSVRVAAGGTQDIRVRLGR